MPALNRQTGFANGKASEDNETSARYRRQKSVRWPPADGQPAPFKTGHPKAPNDRKEISTNPRRFCFDEPNEKPKPTRSKARARKDFAATRCDS
jgi:hypothetical protein